MTVKDKDFKNPVLNACTQLIQEEANLSKKKSAQYTIINEARKTITELDLEERSHHEVLCKAIADEILSRDLNLDDAERSFLDMPLVYKKFSKKPGLTLLESVISRNRYNLYPPKDEEQVLLSSKVQKVIGPVDQKTFIRNLNKKLESILKFKRKVMVYNELHLRTLKTPPQEKVSFEIEFMYSTP